MQYTSKWAAEVGLVHPAVVHFENYLNFVKGNCKQTCYHNNQNG